jgi:hypothetical protein
VFNLGEEGAKAGNVRLGERHALTL